VFVLTISILFQNSSKMGDLSDKILYCWEKISDKMKIFGQDKILWRGYFPSAMTMPLEDCDRRSRRSGFGWNFQHVVHRLQTADGTIKWCLSVTGTWMDGSPVHVCLWTCQVVILHARWLKREREMRRRRGDASLNENEQLQLPTLQRSAESSILRLSDSDVR